MGTCRDGEPMGTGTQRDGDTGLRGGRVPGLWGLWGRVRGPFRGLQPLRSPAEGSGGAPRGCARSGARRARAPGATGVPGGGGLGGTHGDTGHGGGTSVSAGGAGMETKLQVTTWGHGDMAVAPVCPPPDGAIGAVLAPEGTPPSLTPPCWDRGHRCPLTPCPGHPQPGDILGTPPLGQCLCPKWFLGTDTGTQGHGDTGTQTQGQGHRDTWTR